MECEFCSSGGLAGEACACAELEAEYLASNSDSLCSLQQAEAASGSLLYDTWLVNEFCELGHLLVQPPFAWVPHAWRSLLACACAELRLMRSPPHVHVRASALHGHAQPAC